MTDAIGRVRRALPVADPAAGARQPDFACAYEVALAQGDTRSSEQCARDIWEEAPAPLRWAMLAGWRLVLRLRLGPPRSPDHVLGWRIASRGPSVTIGWLDSWFLSASNVFSTADGTFTWSTFVTYERPVARVIWPSIAPVHRLIARIALRRAVTARGLPAGPRVTGRIVIPVRDACLMDGEGHMDDQGTPRGGFTSFSPIFPVRDLRRALAHYAALGFEVRPYAGGDFYGFADRDGVGLHLECDEHHEHLEHGGHGGHVHHPSAYLYVEDADALYDEWARPGVGGLTRRVGDTPYKLREGSHVDPDGNLIRFGSPMPARPAERLRAHLGARYGIAVEEMTELDLGVWRVGRADGPDWVARWFPARRPAAAAAGDAAILRYLAAEDFPAERCAADEPVSDLDGRAVLVTGWADPVPRDQRRDAIRAAGGLRRLGALLGRLHTLDAGDETARPGGAWHHLADGLPSAEIEAAGRMLAEAAPVIPDAERAAFDALRAEVAALDSADGLPEALTHPDFVLDNVVASGGGRGSGDGGGMVLVDWAGAGRGPRLWSLAFFLYAEAVKGPRRAASVLLGYDEHVTLEPEELDRLGAVARARPLILSAWSVALGHTTPTDAMTAAAKAKTLTGAMATRIREALR